ncbi:MAG TPA: hypothetical protein VGK32_04510 [Vicinamibacterales bacterium]|jgi:hypothetical protein
MGSSSKFQPALLGGLLLGVLSALPVISVGNVCCCLWVLAGGAVAAYILQNNQPAPISTGDGAATGLLAGLIGAVVWQGLAVPVGIVMGPLQTRMIDRFLQNAGDMPENMRPFFEAVRQNAGFSIARFVIGFFFVLMISLIFSTIGGVIGAAIFRKKDLPAGPDSPGTLIP